MSLFIAFNNSSEPIPIGSISFFVASGEQWIEYETSNGQKERFFGAYLHKTSNKEETEIIYVFYKLPDPELTSYINELRLAARER